MFDYIAAGIPAVVHLSEVLAVIERYGCGLVLGEVTPVAIRATLKNSG